MNRRRVLEMLVSIAQETRLDVFLLLVEAGEDGMTAGDIAARLGVLPASLSHHLNDLKAAGLVTCVRNHRQLIYSARIPAMQDLVDFLTRNCCGGRPELCAPQWATGEGNIPMRDKNSDRLFNVLFLCTGNSARSLMAEKILNRLGMGKFKAFSAGSMPAGTVNPQTVALLRRLNYVTDDLRSKSWDAFTGPDAPALDFVFTVCDKAAREVCPVWPGQPMSAHWGVPDPALATGTDAEIAYVFTDTYRMLFNRISIFSNLPIASLDRLSLQRRLDEIGRHDDTATSTDGSDAVSTA